MTKKYIKHKQLAASIAKDRIAILFNIARKEASDPSDEQRSLAKRHVYVARKIAMRVRMPLDWNISRQACKKCNAFLLAGSTARTRVQGKGKNAHLVVTCLSCGNIKRYHYRRPRVNVEKNKTGACINPEVAR